MPDSKFTGNLINFSDKLLIKFIRIPVDIETSIRVYFEQNRQVFTKQKRLDLSVWQFFFDFHPFDEFICPKLDPRVTYKKRGNSITSIFTPWFSKLCLGHLIRGTEYDKIVFSLIYMEYKLAHVKFIFLDWVGDCYVHDWFEMSTNDRHKSLTGGH